MCTPCRYITACLGFGSSTGKCDHGVFMVQEHLGGGSLRQLLQANEKSRGRLYSWRTCALWMCQLAQAVEHMHSVRPVMVIHRDIKSDNVMLTGDKGTPEEADVKLGDLGLHRQVCGPCDGHVSLMHMPVCAEPTFVYSPCSSISLPFQIASVHAGSGTAIEGTGAVG